MGRILVSMPEVKERITAIFTKTGVPQADAAIIADTLLAAEAQGRESHGLMRVPALYSRILNGKVNKQPNMQFSPIGTNLFSVDGDNGLGAVLASRTMDFCENVAREHGLAVAAVKNANHLGAAGYYTAKAAEDGFLAFVTTNAGPNVSPVGGMSKYLGTSPFSVSFPAGKYENFTLDIASSASAYGKIMMYAKEGKPIPLGWAMDKEGHDTTDAQAAVDAVNAGIGILPMAAHKGMGICMIVDVLAGLLSGAKLSYQVGDMFSTNNLSGVGFFYIVLDIRRFMPLEQFTSQVEEWFDLLKSSKPRPGTKGVFIPGELELQHQRKCGDTLDVFDGSMQAIERIEKELA